MSDASKDFDLVIISEIIKYMTFLTRHKNAEQIHIMANKSFECAADFQELGTRIPNVNASHEAV
jgi:hypothetical protein